MSHSRSHLHDRTAGERIADTVASTMGSWPFIITQSTILAGWIVLNVLAIIHHWDPYPFILLNLMLSFQAAYAAPFIMMSQNRQASKDRKRDDLEAQEVAADHKLITEVHAITVTQRDLMLDLHDIAAHLGVTLRTPDPS